MILNKKIIILILLTCIASINSYDNTNCELLDVELLENESCRLQEDCGKGSYVPNPDHDIDRTVPERICKCDKGYITDDGGVCNYEKKKKWILFIASFLGGWTGVDWFILARGNTDYKVTGAFKLILSFIVFVFFCRAMCSVRRGDPYEELVIVILVFFISTASFCWWMIDWIRILDDLFPDGNGIGLQNAI